MSNELKELQDEYERRLKNTLQLIRRGDIEADDYVCKCGRINVFGGEGYVDFKTKVFHCGYCE